MNIKKIIAATAALVIMGGTMPAVQKNSPAAVITASAADYETVTEGYVTYNGSFADFISVKNASADVNKDNVVDGRDASTILAYYARISTGYPGTLEDFLGI